MGETGFVSNNVFLNYYSFGSLLLFLTSMLVSGVFLFIDRKVSSTKHLAIGIFFSEYSNLVMLSLRFFIILLRHIIAGSR
ncbi:hypothetical protein LEP1GSC038_4510 [Leptospira weilii str. 2006001855]|uniref:Uncharacterized protein n=1 Tax=Leptospira weilii str. 2006001855 TaxID=996804 RepID=M6G6N0_9LEPT|nr:hypothetical protein LEP1GSC038_4510 [Leptospira weilii str. 2006001855]